MPLSPADEPTLYLVLIQGPIIFPNTIFPKHWPRQSASDQQQAGRIGGTGRRLATRMPLPPGHPLSSLSSSASRRTPGQAKPFSSFVMLFSVVFILFFCTSWGRHPSETFGPTPPIYPITTSIFPNSNTSIFPISNTPIFPNSHTSIFPISIPITPRHPSVSPRVTVRACWALTVTPADRSMTGLLKHPLLSSNCIPEHLAHQSATL